MKAELYNITSGSFGAIASAFVIESLEHMIVWIVVMFAVVFADLITGLMKCYKTKQKIRPSRAFRDTIAKAVSYFAAVVSFCMIDVANGGGGSLEKWCCGFLIVIELISIAGNLLKANGYNFDVNKAIEVILSKKLDCAKEDVEGVITKEERGKRK